MTKVLITGGSGLIGKHLCKLLQEKGYEVALLSRSPYIRNDIPVYTWDPGNNEIDDEALVSADVIIHLAGLNIGEKRWTAQRKRQILESRVQPGELIRKNLEKLQHKPSLFVSSSATGYYGASTSDRIFLETDPPAGDFLGETCRQWEAAALSISELGIRCVQLRTGIVLTSKGGALSKIALPVKLGVGSALGTGRQYIPWIHIDDLCNLYLKAIEDQTLHGAYNAVAPDHITNLEFTRKLARQLNRPFWFPNIPSLALKLVLGEMSVVVLEGSRVSAEKILAAGFTFQFPDLEGALGNLISRGPVV